MILKNEMQQKSGESSINVQIKELNNGLSYSEVKEICMDLITYRLDLYKDDALKEAKLREEKLRNDFIEELEKNKMNLEEFKNPSMQLCYVDAQKGYISYGDQTSEKMLLELLKNRMTESNKSILQISLNEAVKVAPLLMKKHLNALSVLFFVNDMIIMGAKTREELLDSINNLITKLAEVLDLKQIDYEHLEYNKCVTKTEITKRDIYRMTKQKYKYYFLKEISITEFQKKYPQLIKYIGVLDFFTVDSDNVLRFKYIDSCLSYNETDQFSVEDKEIMGKMIEDLIISNEEFEKVFTNNKSVYSVCLDWKDSLMASLNLTTVGKILAMTNLKIELEIPIDMSIWI